MTRRTWAGLWILLPLAGSCGFAHAATPSPTCDALSRAPRLNHWAIDFAGASDAHLALRLPPHRSVLVEIVESGVDVDAELTVDTHVVQRTDNPIRRSGVQRVLLQTGPAGAVDLTARIKAHAGTAGHIEVRAIDANIGSLGAGCRAVVEAITNADAAYATAQQISTGKITTAATPASELYLQARQNYEVAFDRLDPDREAPLRAQLAHTIAAVLYQDLERWQESAQWAQRAAELYDAVNDPYGRARSEALQAAGWMELATTPDARTATEVTRRDSEALLRRAEDQLAALSRFFQSRREWLDAGLVRNNLGLALYYGGEYDAAIRAYRGAIPIDERAGYTYGLAQVTQNMALAEWDLGRVSDALHAYERALQLISLADSPRLYAEVLNNCGLANRSAGHLDAALAQHTQALELARKIQLPKRQAESLFGIAMVYTAAGDQKQAAAFLHEALDLWATAPEPRSQVGGLRALALIEAQTGHDSEAVRLEREGLQIATEARTRARLLVQAADSESRLGEATAARDDLTLASQIAAGAGPVTTAGVDLERGTLELQQGHIASARRLTRAALTTDRALGLTAPSFEAVVAAARIEAAAGDSAAALRYLNEGLRLSEGLRVQAFDPELRATSMQPLRPAFDMEVGLWVQRYQDAMRAGDRLSADRAARSALAVTERSRVRAMEDIALADYADAPAAALSPLLVQKSALIRDIAAHEYRLEEGTTPGVGAAIQTDISHLRAQLALIDSHLASLGESPARVQTTGASIGIDRIPADSAVVSYWLGTSQSYAWIASRSRLQLISLGATAALRAAAGEVQAVFGDPAVRTVEDRLHADARLSEVALRPVLARLPAGTTRLVLIPDGALDYVSFAALPLDGDAPHTYLIQRYELAYGASLGSILRAPANDPPTDDRMLLVADPVYNLDDDRLRSNAGVQQVVSASEPPRWRNALLPDSLGRLPATADEAATIARTASRLQVDRLEGFSATREAVLHEPLERYRYIHFAVHATTDASIPQLSSLVFSRYDPGGRAIDNRIWAGDLMTRRFHADTVVLSACETALGADIGGEGLLGLRYVVLARGARSVVASLWDVPDRSTDVLMQAFYRGLLQERRRPESALALAMRQSLQSGPRDPAFWAAFTTTLASLN